MSSASLPCLWLSACFAVKAPEVQDFSDEDESGLDEEEHSSLAGATQAGERQVDEGPEPTELAEPATRIPLRPCSAEARELMAQVNLYRSQNGKPKVAESSSLCTVAYFHTEDLLTDAMHEMDPSCAPQSWSGSGVGSRCCYGYSGEGAECSWDKPAEITEYPAEGYEIVAIHVDSWRTALDAWVAVPSHRDLLLNLGQWQGSPWLAMGAEMRDGHAVLWVGTSVDPASL